MKACVPGSTGLLEEGSSGSLQQQRDQHCQAPWSTPPQDEDSEKMVCLTFYSASGKDIRMFLAGASIKPPSPSQESVVSAVCNQPS